MKLIWLYLLGVGIGIVLSQGYFIILQKPISSIPTSIPTQILTKTPKYTFSIGAPPSESLIGEVASKSGTLLLESRTATMPAEMKEVNKVMQGERIITDASSSAHLLFKKFGSIEMSEYSDISLIQTLPVDFVVLQRKGQIRYIVNNETPLSIRMRSAIITMKSGKIEVKMADGDSIILISPQDGDARIGFNDLDIVSQVFTLRSGEVYEYNSDERTAINTKNK